MGGQTQGKERVEQGARHQAVEVPIQDHLLRAPAGRVVEGHLLCVADQALHPHAQPPNQAHVPSFMQCRDSCMLHAALSTMH